MQANEQSQPSAEVLSAGLKIVVSVRGKDIINSSLMFIPNDTKHLVQMIKQIIEVQCAEIEKKDLEKE
jgi:hypothetical protein